MHRELAGNNTIDEAGLGKLRDQLGSITETFQIIRDGPVSLRIPQGVGKSTKVDNILANQLTFDVFDLVVVVAPTNSILNERLEKSDSFPYKYLHLKPRPQKRCGVLNQKWLEHERLGRASFAKRALCKMCSRKKGCSWLKTLKKKLNGVRIVLCTEQHLINDTSFLLRLQCAATAKEVLVILDEAKFSKSSFESFLAQEEIEKTGKTLELLLKNGEIPAEAQGWINELIALKTCTTTELSSRKIKIPESFNNHAVKIQSEGQKLFGPSFPYVGYQLVNLASSRASTRRKDLNGNVKFTSRPFFSCKLLILSAHLPAPYLKRQLGIDKIQSPFEKVRVSHSRSNIYNLRSLLGASNHFHKNRNQILDFFAKLICRNILQNRTTILVSKKDLKHSCITYLKKRLLQWGFAVNFICTIEKLENLGAPNPSTIPVIHYGILGVNSLKDYQSCYCLNSFYIPPNLLSNVLQSSEPERYRVPIKVFRDVSGYRRVFVDTEFRHSDVKSLADDYLQVLEVDPVLQAAGRCRFFTEPREVIFFQTNDLRPEFGELTEFLSIQSASKHFQLPSTQMLSDLTISVPLQQIMGSGISLRKAAATIGVDKTTASRVLKRITLSQNAFPLIEGFLRHLNTTPHLRSQS